MTQQWYSEITTLKQQVDVDKRVDLLKKALFELKLIDNNHSTALNLHLSMESTVISKLKSQQLIKFIINYKQNPLNCS